MLLLLLPLLAACNDCCEGVAKSINKTVTVAQAARSAWAFGLWRQPAASYKIVDLFRDSQRQIEASLAAHCLAAGLPYVDAAKARLSVDYQIMFSAALWIPEEALYLVVARVYSQGRNSFAYASFFDFNWRPLATERQWEGMALPAFLPIPVADSAAQYAGPEDSRLFRFGGETLCIFNMLDGDDGRRKMWLFSFASRRLVRLASEKYFGRRGGRLPQCEKNWTPLVAGDRLLLLYNYRGLQLMDCSLRGRPCRWLQGQFNAGPDALRGGSPFRQVRDGSAFYFSIAYTHLPHPSERCDVYRPAIAIVEALSNGAFLLAHTSGPLTFANLAFDGAGWEADVCGAARVLTVPSIAYFDAAADLTVVTANLNDRKNLAISLNGVAAYLDAAIAEYRQSGRCCDCAKAAAIEHFRGNKI